MIRNLILAAVCLLATATPTSAGDISDFDVLGIRIGMSAEAVRSVASSKKLAKRGEVRAPSFKQAVALNAQKNVPAKSYAGIKTLKFSNKDERLEVRFAQTAEGSRVRQIIYEFLGSDLSSEEMTASILEKYGPPDKEVMGRSVWGDTALPFSRKSAWLEYDASPPTAHGRKPVGMLTLSDPAFERKAKEAIKNTMR